MSDIIDLILPDPPKPKPPTIVAPPPKDPRNPANSDAKFRPGAKPSPKTAEPPKPAPAPKPSTPATMPDYQELQRQAKIEQAKKAASRHGRTSTILSDDYESLG